MAKVLALIERDEREGMERGSARAGTVRRSACALLALARRLGEPVAVVGGAPPAEEMIRALGRHGATEIWSADTGSPPATDTDILAALAGRLDPVAILIPSSARGQETAARLAVRLDAGIITGAVDLRSGPGGEPIAVQHCLAGSYFVESSVVRGVPVITVSPEAAVPEPHPVEPALHSIAVEPARTRAPRIAAIPRPRPAHPALDQADIVVAGGRGVGSRAAFAVLAEVADALGAAVAGSHTAAELGWIPPEARVGLTGKTVHPDLYLACGLSGSVRHRAGMQGAKTVVAIGDDPNAPIFQLADLGVVGDARAILPALLAEIRARTGAHDPR
jgi:electron transfer flavoprotein alpha subunit